MTLEKQSETEWLHSQLELIASNRAVKMFADTINEYQFLIEHYQLTQSDAIDLLKQKYQIND